MSWFIVVQSWWFNRSGSIVVVCGGSIVVVRGGSWWFNRGGSWWFVVVRGGLPWWFCGGL